MTSQEYVRTDGLLEAFIRLEESMNVNANQIVIVDGAIQADELRAAISIAAAGFPLLLSGPTRSGRAIRRGVRLPDEIPLCVVDYAGKMGMQEVPFRRFLMRLSGDHPVRWRHGPPVQFFLVRGNGGHRSCLLMNSHHAVGDAKGDSLLVSAIMERYGELLKPGGNARVRPAPPKQHDFQALETMFPEDHTVAARITAGLASAWSVVVDVVTRDIGLQAPATRNGARRLAGTGPGTLDFHHEVLDESLQAALMAVSRTTDHTINTLFSGALVRRMGKAAASTRGTRKARFLCACSLRPRAAPRSREDYRNFMVPCNVRASVGVSAEELLREIGSQVKRLKSGALFSHIARFANLGRILRIAALRKRAPGIVSVVQGSNACYSNPGVIEERFAHFGTRSLPIAGYIGFGCLVPPYHFILYTPMIHGRIHLNAVYRADVYADFERYFVAPFKEELWGIIEELAGKTMTASAGSERAARRAAAGGPGVLADK